MPYIKEEIQQDLDAAWYEVEELNTSFNELSNEELIECRASLHQRIKDALIWLDKHADWIREEKEIPVTSCPHCNSINIRKDFDNPNTMKCCNDCGCDFMNDGEIILNPSKL